MIASATPSRVVVDYFVTGPRTPQAVLKGESRLVRMLIAHRPDQIQVHEQDFAAALRGLGMASRVYPDALFARAVEGWEELPAAHHFDDFDTLVALVSGEARSYCNDKTRTETETSEEPAIRRVEQVARCHTNLLTEIDLRSLRVVYEQIELPTIDPTITMIANGLSVDTAMLEELRDSYEGQLAEIQSNITSLVGHSVNLRWDIAVAKLLYDELRLPIPAYTRKGNPSTTIEALQQITHLHPVVPELLRFTQSLVPCNSAAQLLRTIVQGTNRIQPCLNPLGACTGRFTCSGPNLQSVPSELLHSFVAEPGHVLVEADFCHVELRVLAHITQEPYLLATFAADLDPHARTAAAVLGIPESRISAEQRDQFGKQVNFPIIYGQTPEGLASGLAVSRDEAAVLIQRFFSQHPRVAEWIQATHNFADAYARVKTPYGRIRNLPHAHSDDRKERGEAQRQAVNTIIQGGAAELNKLAIIRLHDTLPAGCRLVLTVHDSVLLEVPEERAAEIVQIAKTILEQLPPNFTVPLRVAVGVGRTWAECKGPHPAGDGRHAAEEFQSLEAAR